MPWGEIKLEDLQKVGLDPADLKTVKDSLAGLDDRIKNAATEANKATASSLEELRGQLNAIATKLNAAAPPNKDTNNNNNNNNEEPVDWILDPEKATRKLIADSIGGVAVTAATMRADMNYTTFKSTNPRAFNKYETEIKAIWDKESLVQRQNPDLIKNIYKIVIADHVDEIAKQGETFFLEPSTSGNSHTNNDVKRKPEELLTKDELELATKWGVSPEDYLKEKSGITGVAYA